MIRKYLKENQVLSKLDKLNWIGLTKEDMIIFIKMVIQQQKHLKKDLQKLLSLKSLKIISICFKPKIIFGKPYCET